MALAAKSRGLVDQFGHPTTQPSNDLPAVKREPPITIAPDFKTVQDCKDAVTALDFGQFMVSTWLIEQMFWQPRVRGVTNTREDGLVGTPIRWEAANPNGKGANDTARRAARDIVVDWPLIASAPVRKQLFEWGLYLGAGFAQKHWYESPSTGRWIPRLEVYHPQWCIWDWFMRAYRVWTLDGWAIVPSPSLMVPGQAWQPMYPVGQTTTDKPDTLRRWVVHEPFGQHSWRRGMVHSVWDPWLGLVKANRNLHRSSEKMGVGIAKASYPKSTEKASFNLFLSYLRSMGSEGVIPVEQWEDEVGGGVKGYDVQPFEWTQTGADIITRDREACLADIAVLVLGHNTTAETKGASVGASAQVGNLIRGDIRVGDTLTEFATYYPQVIRDWAEVNYGDPALAPIPVYVTDPPSENQAAAQTLLWFSQALATLRQNAPGTDWSELFNRFLVPAGPSGPGVLPPEAKDPSMPHPPKTDGKDGIQQ